ncbi:MAG: hypothetical protein VX938_08995, partial [Myxococcota bacterium]|nr:hypothetical protein [Myxococcota bacterium]
MRRVVHHIIITGFTAAMLLLSVGCSEDPEGDSGSGGDTPAADSTNPSSTDDTVDGGAVDPDGTSSLDAASDGGPDLADGVDPTADGGGADGQPTEEDVSEPVVPGPLPAPTDDGYPGAGLVVKIVSPGGNPREA